MSDKLTDKTRFSDLMADVKRLDDDRINIYQDRVMDKAFVRKKTVAPESTDFSNINYHVLKNIDESFFHSSISKKQQRKIREGAMQVDAHLDLHGCNQQQATQALSQFFQQAVSDGCRFLIVVHGKGNRSEHQSVLKPLVHHWLAQQSFILSWCPAQARHGGTGASYIYLHQASAG